MTRLISVTFDGAGLSRRVDVRLKRIEKASKSSEMPDDARNRGEAGGGRHADHPCTELSHNETGEREPLWYGPGLRPTFVTQVLAQALGTAKPDQASAFAAYGNDRGLATARRFSRRA